MKTVTSPVWIQDVNEKQMISSQLMVNLESGIVNPVFDSLRPIEKSFDENSEAPESPILLNGVVESENEEYIVRTYRALSAAVIDCYGLDFRKEGVLEAGLGLFKTDENGNVIPTYKNHSRDIDSWLGLVQDAYYDKSSDPPGVNQILAFDKIACGEKITRGVKSRALNCVSVTVTFEWEKSHPTLDDDIFWKKWWCGEEVDGKRVLVVANKITSIKETSLVWKGADKYATGRKSSASEENMDNVEMNETEQKPEEVAGKTEETVAPTEEVKPTESLIENELRDRIANMEEKITQLQSKADLADALLADVRCELNKFIALTMDNEGAKTVMQLAEKADHAQLKAMLESYKKKADEMYFFRCDSCGGSNVSRQSSVKPVADNEAKNEDDISHRAKSILEIKREFNRERVLSKNK